MKKKFSDGPWGIIKTEHNGIVAITVSDDEGRSQKHFMNLSSVKKESVIENAKLVSIAPEMFDLLVDISNTLKTYYRIGTEWKDKIDYLLNKINVS